MSARAPTAKKTTRTAKPVAAPAPEPAAAAPTATGAPDAAVFGRPFGHPFAAPFSGTVPGVTLPPPLAQAAERMQGIGSSLLHGLQSLAGLKLEPQSLIDIQQGYARDMASLWNQTLSAQSPAVKDRRFAGEAWQDAPGAGFMAAAYLLNARALMQLADAVQGDEKTRARIRFAVQQWVDASAPSNYLALNPDAQRKALQTQGESIAHGMAQLLQDLKQGHLSQTDESVFEVGRNVATTEGAVVFENELFQLLEYKPLTAKVHERPILFVPPCINKYYILDLQPENSLIRYTVEQGHRVFVMSWRNPTQDLAGKTWDDYIEDGVIRAIRTVQEIGGQTRFNMLGFCVGGTLLATALAVLAARGEQPAASLTLLTSFLDFSHTGVIDVFVDEAAVRLREVTIGLDNPQGPGLLRGQELATTFSFLRPNDLVWNYVVANYLKGETPPPFDLLYWNSDSTGLPGPMFCWYLRHTYLQNDLRVPGKVSVCGVPVNLGAISAPAFLYASREDHIVPWESAYASTSILKGPKRFVLGASGHIAGVINPPAKKKRSYWAGASDAALPADAAAWLAGAVEQPGSWWTSWSDWLKSHAGALKPATKTPGNRQHPPVEPAPGRYVKQKAAS